MLMGTMGLMVQTMKQERDRDPAELEELLLCIARGEQQALEELYRRTRGAVYALALSYLKNAHDAQDVTQDAFVRVWEGAVQYRPQGSPMAWLLTIARNLARMKLRQGARQAELSDEEWEAIPADSPGVTPEDRELLQTALLLPFFLGGRRFLLRFFFGSFFLLLQGRIDPEDDPSDPCPNSKATAAIPYHAPDPQPGEQRYHCRCDQEHHQHRAHLSSPPDGAAVRSSVGTLGSSGS